MSAKPGKDSTSTLSLVIHGEIKKEPAKKYISIQGQVKLKKSFDGGFLSFTLSFFYLERLHCC
jgi:hypothetical protein